MFEDQPMEDIKQEIEKLWPKSAYAPNSPEYVDWIRNNPEKAVRALAIKNDHGFIFYFAQDAAVLPTDIIAPVLIDILMNDPNPLHREGAALALAKGRRHRTEAVINALKYSVVNDPNRGVRDFAEESLENLLE
ncbi:MAG TPA: HEAT repeat domain-containing protein [Chitinophagaceae bacterium]